MQSDNQKIPMKSMLLEEISKEHVSHQKPVSHTEMLYDGRKSTEIDSLQISKLKDSSKESRVSSMSENFSDEKPPRAIVMPGEIKKGNPCLH